MIRPNDTLTQRERDALLAQLNEEQRKFVHELLKRGKRTAFANVLAKEKAGVLADGNMEIVADQWELMDYLDAGPNWQQNSQLYCECGRPLRYQYVVQNNVTGEIKRFGMTHFQEHTGISPQLAREIVKGIERIDYELDEILQKFSYGWSLTDVGLVSIPKEIELPRDIGEQLNLELPLLDRQVNRVKQRIADYWKEKKRKRVEELLREEVIHKEQRELVYAKQKEFVVEKLRNKSQQLASISSLKRELIVATFVFLENLTDPEFLASDVCKDLIENHGASTERFSSGRYKIFPDVCTLLENLVSEGILEFIEKRDVVDRLYRIRGAEVST
ncbi:DUF3895 domain-containing protein [Ornithinibacillus halotolerans]|uniref:DUF3895 domain-containing protein n=1 Tax=Ornithinibacillus halotolerans TaxID=1274357 RepID=A0A916WA61_9BACI|nr:DUF3895 domain-containing protein [Ornithinibacillus halotolerans]GGA80526.1 hypothetical protein GCM10008025_24930 [Ornithinibacillus halotolerans]